MFKFHIGLALALNALSMLGMQLVWFQGDQTYVQTRVGNATRVVALSNPSNIQLTYFCLLIATMLLSSSIALRSTPIGGLLRSVGTFFFIMNIETGVCAVPSVGLYGFDENHQRRDVMYAGSVFVLLGVFISFAVSYLDGLRVPTSGVAGRVGSIRGLTFLLSACLFIVCSAVQWSWDTQCNAAGRDIIGDWYPVTNAILAIMAFIFVSAVVYGDYDGHNISVFLAATTLFLGVADPLFDSDITWAEERLDKFSGQYRVAKGLAFIACVILLLSVLVTSKRSKSKLSFADILSRPVACDVVCAAVALSGALCVFTKNRIEYSAAFPTTASPAGRTIVFNDIHDKHVRDYAASYAIVVCFMNLFLPLIGVDGGQLVALFFSAAALRVFDGGSNDAETGYVRGGLQLCQASVLASTLLKAFPVDKPLLSYVKPADTVATLFTILWILLAMVHVPTNYSIFILVAVITYRAVTTKSADWGRGTFYILSWYGITAAFPLKHGTVNDYRNSAFWVGSVMFAIVFACAGWARPAPTLNPPEVFIAESDHDSK